MQDPSYSVALKPTVNDIARVAGVSLATVDRVLNARPGVRLKTKERVNDAIAQLGYVRDTAAANLARKRQYRFLFLLPEIENEFIEALEQEISEQAQLAFHSRTHLSLRKVRPFDPLALVSELDRLDEDVVDGVAVFGPETASVRDAVNRCRERGIAVVALVSDQPSSDRDRFVGIDNVAAGRTAARLMGGLVKSQGHILVITGSRLARDHLERRSGFDAVMGESFPQLSVAATIEGHDNPETVQSMLPKAFASYPDLTGIYSSAAGNLGLINFLETCEQSKDLVIIAHELTPSTRSALEKGHFDALISQDKGHLVRSTIRVLKATKDRNPIDPTQERIRIDIYLQDNIPPEQ